MFRALRNTHSPRKIAVLLALVAASGCSLATDVTSPSVILIFSGNQQTGPTNTTLPDPLAVIVANQFGERLQNATVTWTIVSGDGMLSATTTMTDGSGIASVTFTTGATKGPVVIQARVEGLPSLTFNITVT